MTTRPQTIFRAAHGKENPYFMHRRKTAQDKRLSFEARGLLGYLLSKPDDWEISESDLRKEGGIGRDKVKKLIAELVKHGYMTKEQPHDSDKGRFLQNVYIAHEIPLTENPLTVLPLTVNPQEHNKDSLENTEKDTTDPDGSVVSKSKATKTRRIPASRMNPMKDAIVAAFEWDSEGMNKYEWGLVQKAARLLCESKVEPADVVGLYGYCKREFSNFGPTALASNVQKWRKTLPVNSTTPRTSESVTGNTRAALLEVDA